MADMPDTRELRLTHGGGKAERIYGTWTSADDFGVLGIHPILGRASCPRKRRMPASVPGGAPAQPGGCAIRFRKRPSHCSPGFHALECDGFEIGVLWDEDIGEDTWAKAKNRI
jgi:hypothetical protein